MEFLGFETISIFPLTLLIDGSAGKAPTRLNLEVCMMGFSVLSIRAAGLCTCAEKASLDAAVRIGKTELHFCRCFVPRPNCEALGLGQNIFPDVEVGVGGPLGSRLMAETEMATYSSPYGLLANSKVTRIVLRDAGLDT